MAHSFFVKAQIDPHFSQYYAYPLWLNPALTGEFDGSVRVGTNLRDQWQAIPNAYKTAGVSADFRTNSKLNFGINILDQRAGDVGFNYLSAYGSISYEILLSGTRQSKLNFGIQGGILNRNYDINKLEFDNQYNPLLGFDPNLPSGELSLHNNAMALDFNSGLFYYEDDPNHSVNKFLGIGFFHINRGINPYPVEGIQKVMPLRYSIHGGLNIHTSPFLILTPHFIFEKEQSNQILALGFNTDYALSQNQGLILGALVRVQDAFSLNAGFYLHRIALGFSYDFTTSSLIGANLGQGGPEISFTYTLPSIVKGSNRICPRF